MVHTTRNILCCALMVGVLPMSLPLHAQQADEEEELAKYQPYRDYGTDWRLAALFGITPEDGILVGPGAIVYKFAFRKFPYLYRMELVGGLTLKTGRWKFRYTAGFPVLSEKLSLDILAYASELEVRNFYGFGNNTPRDRTLERNDFYRVLSRQYFLQPTARWSLAKGITPYAGASLKHVRIRTQPDRFLSPARLDALGESGWALGTGAGVDLKIGPDSLASRTGFRLSLSAWNFSYPFERRTPFQKYAGEVRVYAGLGPFTLALRSAAEKVAGDAPFHEMAFLGGAASLRGYNLNRFAGDASVLGSAEVRFDLFELKFIVSTHVGAFAFGDAGRVFVGGSSPGGWHADAGAGISLAPVSREMTFTVSVASSPEGVFVTGGVGFAF